MNGPQNAAAAEELIADARIAYAASEDPAWVALLMAEAEVRATIALALATAAPMMGTDARGNWNEAAR